MNATTEAIDARAAFRAKRKAEMIERLAGLGLKVEPYDHREWVNKLKATDPKAPDVSIELMHQDRGFSEAWMVGKRHSAIARRRFPRHNSGGFNYEGIAKAIREMIEQRLRLRAQIAETKEQIAKQEVEDERRRKHFQAERQKLVQYGFIAAEDRRVVADEDGLRLFVERRDRDKDMAGLRMKVEISIGEVGTADRMASIIDGVKRAGLWEAE